MPTEAQISKPPTRTQAVTDTAFRALCQGFTWLVAVIAVIIVLKIVLAALPAIQQYGLGFLSGQVWDPHKKVYSILPEIWGTLYSSVLALIFGTAFGVAAAIFQAEGFTADAVFALL